MAYEFNIFAYAIEIYYNNKYYGNIIVDQPDRKVMGYMGRKEVTLTEDFVGKKKMLPKGTKVYTECVPLCGRIK